MVATSYVVSGKRLQYADILRIFLHGGFADNDFGQAMDLRCRLNYALFTLDQVEADK